MDDVDAKHRGKAAGRERQPVRGTAHDAAAHIRMATLDRILRDFESPGVESRHHLHQVAHEEAFGAADVEHAVAGFESEMRRNVAGNGNPAPVVAVAAITLLARAVEIFAAKPACDAPVLRLAVLAG